MGKLAALVILLAHGALPGCVSSPNGERADAVNVALKASPINAGETGRAILVPLGERTQVTIIVSGVPVQLASRPVHLYTFVYEGVCENFSAQPSYLLTERVLAQPAASAVNGALNITNVAPVAVAKLQREPHVIRIRTSPFDGDREIFCGEIPGSASRHNPALTP